MDRTTYICKNCGYETDTVIRKEKDQIKLNCSTCKRKSIFVNKVNYTKKQSPSSGYRLAADLNISCSHTHIDGIPVEGNVSVTDTTGVKLEKMIISYNEEKKMGGKLKITNSEEFSVRKNIVSNDVKIDSSRRFKIEKNLIGYDFKNSDLLIEAINSLMVEGKSQASIEKDLAILMDS
jgi:hypothetical protein